MVYLVLSLIGSAAKLAGVAFSFRLPSRQWLAVKIWLALALAEDVILYAVWARAGDSNASLLYARVYYWADLVVVFAGLLVLLRLAETALAHTRVDLPMLRGIAIAVIAGAAILSFASVFSRIGDTDHLIAFANEAEQNMAAAGMIAAILLWCCINVLRAPGVRIRRLVAGFGIFYSASACSWSLVALVGTRAGFVVPLLSVASVCLLAYAVAEPEERWRRQRPQPLTAPLAERGAA